LDYSQQPVPLFVAARSESGKLCHMLLKDVETSNEEGPFYCQASAPNGHEAEGVVDRLDYLAVRNLFKARDDLLLELDTGHPIQAGRTLRGVDLQLWSAGEPIDPRSGQFKLVSGPGGTSHIEIMPIEGAPVDHVQMWCEPGAVTVTVWPKGGSLFPVPGLPDVQRRVRPVVLGGDIQCSAYWGFYRNSNLGAVRALGSEMVVRAIEEGSAANDRELAIAAHFALNFLDPTSEVLAPLASLLEERSDSDSAILFWAIAFDTHLHYTADDRRLAFERAVLSLAGNGCLYTEVFRMLLQRLGDGEESWRRHTLPGKPPPEIEQAIEWAKDLATATYWDTEHLTYRALDPKRPDANATDDQLGIGVKKKSTIVPPG
jgi:hypothetical protein